MTLAYWCVLIALFLPYLSTAAAKFTGGDFGPRQNHDPRTFLAGLEGWRKRANNAQLNAFEVTPAFAIAVVIGHLAGVPSRGRWMPWPSPSWPAASPTSSATWPTGRRCARWSGSPAWG